MRKRIPDLRQIKAIRLKELAGGVCIRCGYGKNYSCLDFHHRDPSQKKFNLMAAGMSVRKWDECVEESGKCDLLCRNCHSDLHWPHNRKDAIDFEGFNLLWMSVAEKTDAVLLRRADKENILTERYDKPVRDLSELPSIMSEVAKEMSQPGYVRPSWLSEELRLEICLSPCGEET